MIPHQSIPCPKPKFDGKEHLVSCGFALTMHARLGVRDARPAPQKGGRVAEPEQRFFVLARSRERQSRTVLLQRITHRCESLFLGRLTMVRGSFSAAAAQTSNFGNSL